MKLKEAWPFYKGDGAHLSVGIIFYLSQKEQQTGIVCGMTQCNDWDYHWNRSNEKEISPLVQKFADLTPPVDFDRYGIKTEWKQMLSDIIWNRFHWNWKTKYDAYFLKDYEPLENYSMVEHVRPDLTHVRTPNLTQTETPDITHLRTPNLTDTETPDITTVSTDSTTNKVNGFNSAVAVPSSASSGSVNVQESGTRTNQHSGTETIKESGTRTTEQSGQEVTRDTGDTQTTRSGNIGVTTSQQMLQSELELRTYDFVQGVYADIDTILTCPLYE